MKESVIDGGVVGIERASVVVEILVYGARNEEAFVNLVEDDKVSVGVCKRGSIVRYGYNNEVIMRKYLCSEARLRYKCKVKLHPSRKWRRPPEKEEVSPPIKVALDLELPRRPGDTGTICNCRESQYNFHLFLGLRNPPPRSETKKPKGCARDFRNSVA
ncbi:hypothetical protein VNO80_10142 [Phaseolus coccineus]|uniref:Uncharacterized protein n=1 Tax=Phaseolus coccineus TaxID=3886 RepID=A0AAN9RA73_PHACN